MDIPAIDHADWRDLASASEMEEALPVDGEDTSADWTEYVEAMQAEYEGYFAEHFDPDDMYSGLR